MKRYGIFKVLTADNEKKEDTYIYAEWENVGNKGKMYGFYWDIIGKDIITGTKIVCRFYVNDVDSFNERLIYDHYRPGIVYLYVDICGCTEFGKGDIISILKSMSKEEIKEYSKKVKDAKKAQREAAKEARKINRSQINAYLQEEKNYRTLKRKSRIIARKSI